MATPMRPYLLRAYHEWMSDNDFTPLLLVDANYHGVEVPVDYIQNGQIVLNIAERATGGLIINNEYVSFQARFNGQVEDIYLPMGSILALYSRESNEGIKFESEVFDAPEVDEAEPSQQAEPKQKKNFLRIL